MSHDKDIKSSEEIAVGQPLTFEEMETVVGLQQELEVVKITYFLYNKTSPHLRI